MQAIRDRNQSYSRAVTFELVPNLLSALRNAIVKHQKNVIGSVLQEPQRKEMAAEMNFDSENIDMGGHPG